MNFKKIAICWIKTKKNIKHKSDEFIFGIKNIPKTFKKCLLNKKQQLINLPTNCRKKLLLIKKLKPKDFLKFFLNNAILWSLLLIILVLIIIDGSLLNKENLINIVSASSTKLIIALGAGTILIGRGVDLSAGRVVGLTSMIAATFSQNILFKNAYIKSVLGYSPFLIIFISIIIGGFIGLINGVIVTKLKVSPFIATLGMMLVVFGINVWYSSKISNGQSIGQFADEYKNFSNKGFHIFGILISWTVIISIILLIFMWILWNKLPFGKKLFAIGGNPKAAIVSGISVSSILIITYILGGMMYGIGGVLESWSNGTASVSSGTMYELDAIAACIVGGLSFNGGKGRILGIVLGVIIFQTITYGFSYIALNSSMTYIVKGIIIVVAVALDMIKNRKSK